jgi:type II secretory pathway component PulM
MFIWWRERTVREKAVLVTGTAALSLIIVYLVLEPVVQERQRLQAEIPILREDLNWMQEHAGELQGLLGGTGAESKVLSLALVEEALGNAGLKQQVIDLRPTVNQAIRLSFDQVAYADLVVFLSRLRQQSGARISEATIRRLEDRDGMVAASLLLAPGA